MAIFAELHPGLEELAACRKKAALLPLLSDAWPRLDDALVAPHVFATLYQALDNPDEMPAEPPDMATTA